MTVNIIQMTAEVYQQRLEEAAALGAFKALEIAGVTRKECYSRRELERKYGKLRVDNVIRSNKLIPRQFEGKKQLGFATEDVVKAFTSK
jgi:hypothetical protein